MHMPHRPRRPSGVDHNNRVERRMNSNFIVSHSIVSRMHVNTTKLRNITCTLIVTNVILWSLKCIWNYSNFIVCVFYSLKSVLVHQEIRLGKVMISWLERSRIDNEILDYMWVSFSHLLCHDDDRLTLLDVMLNNK